MQDILIAVTDGLKGIGESLSTIFPATTLQTCIVHLIRNSLDYASWKDRKLVAAALRPVYTALNADTAVLALRNITADWGRASKDGRSAMNEFAIAYGDRFTRPVA